MRTTSQNPMCQVSPDALGPYSLETIFAFAAAQRGNAMHTALPPQAIVRASPPGMVVSAASFNGRNAGLGNAGGGGIMANSIVATTGGGIGGAVPPNMRYRPAAPYQFVKK